MATNHSSVVSHSTGSAGERVLREIDDLPGPRPWPLVGNLLQVKRDLLHQHVEAWARQYGTLFRFSLGSRRFLAVAGHEEIAAALRDRPDGFRRTTRLEEIGTDAGIPPGVFAANGDVWRRQRRMVMAALDPGHIKAYFPRMMTVTRRLHARWQAAAKAGEWIDVKADFTRFSVDVVTGLAFGIDMNMVETDTHALRTHLDRIFAVIFRRLVAPFPYWRYVKLPFDRAAEQSVQVVKATIAGLVEDARARLRTEEGRRGSPSNLMEAMLSAAGEEGSGITEEDVVGNVLTLLLAGEDTTANTLAWLVWLLHANRGVLDEATKEVDARIGRVDAATLDMLARLDFVEACAHETMRVRPVVPFFLAEAAHETHIGDVRVPLGTVLWFVGRHDTLKEQHFARASAFDPHRWLVEGQHGADSAKRVSMPFGAGPRICPGRYLALVEIKLAMAMLLGQFELVAVEAAGGGDPQERLSFTMGPVGLRMMVRERVKRSNLAS